VNGVSMEARELANLGARGYLSLSSCASVVGPNGRQLSQGLRPGPDVI
jgi:hypothetical protein